ncbi:FtsK/SpoIIIE domain-containing protein [uncultured Microbacterium sp.]|uniref:FtsK/SpoIIIE domain-containing protein n=1 Tax=uncultured Microbacterium sp. TaxID=191216 RepID=UPI002624BEAA|nr:FtsK/SpoIIIE domain-containing protein [uncultured Microbacterium sp.]
MESTTIVLPSAPADTRRPPLPLLAAVVPVAAGIVLWLVTGSLFALCFAALGPLMLVASYVDGLRTRRRERRRGREESDAAWERAETELERLHAQEHADAWRREPGVVQSLQELPLRSGEAPDQRTFVMLGRGARPSTVQARGGDDDRSRAFRTRARELDDAPVSVPLGRGICIRAAGPVAEAVARAIVVQLCLRFGPSLLGISGEAINAWGLSGYPHAGRMRSAFRIALGEGDGRADALICIRMPGEEPPEGVTTVLDCSAPARSRMRTPDGERELAAEALSVQQARIIGAELADRADAETAIPDRIGLDELEAADAGGLAAAIGRGERGDLSVSLVEDGPHAIVTGMTGTGKSELLTSWVTALAATHSPEELAFVLVDFKGGTAFDPLRRLPHVVAVITDLDAEGARRGVGSLTAELRRREAALGRAGVRDVEDCAGLSRLVIVIDEFAALLQEHPDLGAVFTDVAARGRALGMHLVLGTQRASGVIRDALAANCPLRISLRVAEPADSRFVIGSDAAAELPGGTESRGLAFVRRPRDSRAEPARIALTADADIEAAARRWSGHRAQPSPWLPPLPSKLELPADELSAGVVLGLADEPDRQRQPWLHLADGDGLAIIGGPGSGKSSAVALLAAQLPDAVVIPQDPEAAWDVVAQLCAGAHGPVLCDDLDLLAAQYPPDYAQVFTGRWEMIVRAPSTTVITLSRVSGPLGRLIDAVPRHALLRLTSKVEHIAAGGEPAAFDRGRPTGRAWMDGLEVQLCLPAEGAQRDQRTSESGAWRPSGPRTGIITPAVGATAAVLASAHPGQRVMSLRDLAPGAPAAEDAVIVVGDPEEWRAQWALLQGIRTTGELVVAAECATELRQLAGVRELPPYAQLHADRAWSVQAGSPPQRVLLG